MADNGDAKFEDWGYIISLMATQKELKSIAITRAKSAKLLRRGKDWQGAAYLMGLSLECALKACICKNLRVATYPESPKEHKDKNIPDFFMSHSFERLLILSGLTDIFGTTSKYPVAFDNWSLFTIQYPGHDWVAMRYKDMPNFDETLTKNLYEQLYESSNSILKTLTQRKRW